MQAIEKSHGSPLLLHEKYPGIHSLGTFLTQCTLTLSVVSYNLSYQGVDKLLKTGNAH